MNAILYIESLITHTSVFNKNTNKICLQRDINIYTTSKLNEGCPKKLHKLLNNNGRKKRLSNHSYVHMIELNVYLISVFE